MRVVISSLIAMALAKTAFAEDFPDVIDLPAGFFPEGICSGQGQTVYVGSISTGAIWKGDIKEGTGDVIVEGDPANNSKINGIKFDKRSNSLYAAGRDTGKAWRFDETSGDLLDTYDLVASGFINDMIVTRNAVYFTDSRNGQYYALPVNNQGVPDGPATTIPLICDFVFDAEARINSNGIEANANGDTLFIINSTTGKLYTVDAATGCAAEVLIKDDIPLNGDGLVLVGNIMYVVENRKNQIAKVVLSKSFATGEVVEIITNPNFNIPTTAARFGNSLYTVNAKFGQGGGQPDTPHEIVKTTIN